MTNQKFMRSLSILLLSIVSNAASGCLNETELGGVDQQITAMPDARTSDARSSSDAGSPIADAAPAPTKVTTNNVAKTLRDSIADALTTPPTKPTQIRDHGTLDATALPRTPPVSMRTSAMGGTCVKVSNIPDGYLVGSSGAEGCIIAVIVQCDGTVIACHFTAGDNPVATIAALAPFGACAHAAIAGGTNETTSNQTLAGVISALGGNQVTIDGILDRIGVFWDATNNRWVYGPLDVASQNR